MAYKGGVPVNSGFYPRNNFPIMNAQDIYVTDDDRLDGVLSAINKSLASKVSDSVLNDYIKKNEAPNVVNNLNSTSSTDVLSAAQGAVLKNAIDELIDSIGEFGGGDMMKASYDSNGDGIIDNAEKLNGHPADYFATADLVNDHATEIELLKQQIADFLYEKVDITAFNNKIASSFNNINYAEVGSEINEAKLSWTINKTPTRLLLNGIEIDATITNCSLPREDINSNFPLKSDTTYTLVAIDERENTDSMTTKIQFVKPKFYGTIKAGETIDQELLRSNSVILNATKACSFTASPESDEFVFFAMPKDLGIPTFTINNWSYQWDRNEIIDVELLTGEVVEYRVCVSDNPGGASALHKVS